MSTPSSERLIVAHIIGPLETHELEGPRWKPEHLCLESMFAEFHWNCDRACSQWFIAPVATMGEYVCATAVEVTDFLEPSENRNLRSGIVRFSALLPQGPSFLVLGVSKGKGSAHNITTHLKIERRSLGLYELVQLALKKCGIQSYQPSLKRHDLTSKALEKMRGMLIIEDEQSLHALLQILSHPWNNTCSDG